MKSRTSGSSSMTSTEASLRGLRAFGPRSASRRRSAAAALLGGAEQQFDRRAVAGRAGDPRGAARLARHAIDHRQAKAGALADLLGGEEGLEGARRDLVAHARCRCRRWPARHSRRRRARGRRRPSTGRVEKVSTPPSGMASRALIARLSTATSSWVGSAITGSIAVVEVEALLDPRAEHVAQQRPHVLDQRRDMGRPDLQPLDPAERQQLPGQPRPALGGRQRIVGIALELGLVRPAWR